MRARALNLLVFREGRRRVSGAELKSSLLRHLKEIEEGFEREPATDDLIEVLLRAGELECAVADADGLPLETYTNLTDRLAERLVSRELRSNRCSGRLASQGDARFELGPLRRALVDAPVPHELWISAPEGFAYYSLHPLAFAETVGTIPAPAGGMAIIGIRSIGTTLSAVAAAAAHARGLHAGRITVRPAGHPYNRCTEFSREQLQFIEQSRQAGAVFVVVDEGPGLSGSSFLSVAEALERAGASSNKIFLVCGHEPDIDSLRADDGPRRARRFRWIPVSPEPRRPLEAEVFVGGGQWRQCLLPDPMLWPASWTNLERLKYLSPAGTESRRLFKFQGLGDYGKRVLERENILAAAGFCPSAKIERDGFASYPWIAGPPMAAADLSHRELERMAAYCAFRCGAFPGEPTNPEALQRMAEHNLQELKFDLPVDLRIERPVVADGRMQPHEWLRADEGRMLKTDCGSHGDDHFFPGVTDIAWDLAGAIVEWRMNAEQVESFLDLYRRASGDDAESRIGRFVTAYAVFRGAYCMMAANALQGSNEQARLEKAAARYAAVLELRTTLCLG
jgi:hypothetical protein